MISAIVKKYELTAFFILAYAISWIIEIPLILSRHNIIGTVPLSLHYFTAYGPMLAALIVHSSASGSRGTIVLL